MKRLWLLFAQTVTVLLAAYFVFHAFAPQRPAPVQPALPAPTVAPPLPAREGDAPQSFSAAVRRAAPAVVSINTRTTMRHPLAADPWFRFFFGDRAETHTGLGSGVIMHADGYVLTNNHVVAGADAIEVVLPDMRRTAARLIGADQESDLAVLKIELDALPVIALGSSDALQVGDRVLAIGNPFGVGQTVTSGIVSALGRSQLGLNTYENFIQTDAAINPGNSGGALIDADGRLLGINTAIYSRSGGSMGIGFAIPVSTAQQVLGSIVQHGRVIRGWIGVETADLTPELRETFAVPVASGVLIAGVLTDSPAARAGLRPGDLITRVAGQSVASTAELMTRTAALPPGQPARFEGYRRQQALQLDLTPVQRPQARQAQRTLQLR